MENPAGATESLSLNGLCVLFCLSTKCFLYLLLGDNPAAVSGRCGEKRAQTLFKLINERFWGCWHGLPSIDGNVCAQLDGRAELKLRRKWVSADEYSEDSDSSDCGKRLWFSWWACFFPATVSVEHSPPGSRRRTTCADGLVLCVRPHRQPC